LYSLPPEVQILKKLFKFLLGLIVVTAITFAVFWFSRPADVSFDENRTAIPHAEDSHFADIDGVRLHYQEKGTGTPLILIHGYTSSTYSWKDVFEPLSQNFRVIAVDLKGFGFSAKPDGDYTRRAHRAFARLFENRKGLDLRQFDGRRNRA